MVELHIKATYRAKHQIKWCYVLDYFLSPLSEPLTYHYPLHAVPLHVITGISALHPLLAEEHGSQPCLLLNQAVKSNVACGERVTASPSVFLVYSLISAHPYALIYKFNDGLSFPHCLLYSSKPANVPKNQINVVGSK